MASVSFNFVDLETARHFLLLGDPEQLLKKNEETMNQCKVSRSALLPPSAAAGNGRRLFLK